jgi:uncharacterized protein (TIGR02246 family)
MKRFAIAVMSFVLASPALGAEGASGAQGTEAAPAKDPMAGWVPRKVTAEAKDKKEIQALLDAMHEASMKGNLAAATQLVDFPVLMVTDDSRGQAMSEMWSRERWVKEMQPFYAQPMKDAKVTHRPTIYLLTDSLATVGDQWTMTTGDKKVSARSSMLLVRKDGQWRVKSMVEGGWGDTMKPEPEAASQPATPSGAGTGSGAEEPAAPERQAAPQGQPAPESQPSPEDQAAPPQPTR